MSDREQPKITGQGHSSEHETLPEERQHGSVSTPGTAVNVEGYGIGQRLTAYKTTQVAKSLEELIEAENRVVEAGKRNQHAKLEYLDAATALKNFDEEKVRQKIKETYDAEDAMSKTELRRATSELKRAIEEDEQAEHEARLARIRRERELEATLAPKKQKKKQPRDAEAEAMDILLHGSLGPEARATERAIEKLIEQKGGEEALAEEDRENIRIARMLAAQRDNAKS